MTVSHEQLAKTLRQPDELPEGWTEVALGDLVVHALGGEWGAKPAPELPQDHVRVNVVRGTEFRQWDREKGATAAERVVKRSSLARREIKAGDLVVEISGGGPDQQVGRTILVDPEALAQAKHPMICSNFCRQVRLHPEIDPAFVQLGLRHSYARGAFDRFQAQTTNIRNLNFGEFLAGVVLPLPPLAEQRRIVERAGELLDRVDAARQRLERLPGTLRRLRRAALAAACAGRLTEEWRERRGDRAASAEPCAELFDEPLPPPLTLPEVPAGWELRPLRDLVFRYQYGMSIRAEARGGVPILRMGNIRDGRLDVSDLKFVGAKSKNLADFVVARGDILFNRTNSPELVGKAAVFDWDKEAVFASYLVRLVCDESRVTSAYLCGWINSPWGRWWARTVRTDGVSQSNISLAKLLAMPVPVPPLAEQREIVRRLAGLHALAGRIEKRLGFALATAERLVQEVLGAALAGELVPNEADLARGEARDYEPAWKLVERIKAEIETAGGAVRGRRRSRGGIGGGGSGQLALPGEVAPAAMRPRVEDMSSEQILAAFRQACWGAGEMSQDALFRRVAKRLGCKRLTKGVQKRLADHLKLAVLRRIVAVTGELVSGATPNFARYEQEFLLQALCHVMRKGVEYERAAVCRAIAARLGYSQVTGAMRDRMDEIFGAGLRHGVLEARGGRILLRV
jgi:type I restriction enzyme S subunit